MKVAVPEKIGAKKKWSANEDEEFGFPNLNTPVVFYMAMSRRKATGSEAPKLPQFSLQYTIAVSTRMLNGNRV